MAFRHCRDLYFSKVVSPRWRAVCLTNRCISYTTAGVGLGGLRSAPVTRTCSLVNDDGDELKPGRSDEQPIMGSEWHAYPHRGGGDPPIAVVEFVAKCVTNLSAPHAQIGTCGDRLVIRLDDGQLRDTAFEPSAPQIAPAGRAGLRNEVPSLSGTRAGQALGRSTRGSGLPAGWALVEQPADDHGVYHVSRRLGAGHVSANASWKAAQSSSGTSSMTMRSRGGSGRACLSASSGW